MKIYKRFFYLLFFIVLNIQIYKKSAEYATKIAGLFDKFNELNKL